MQCQTALFIAASEDTRTYHFHPSAGTVPANKEHLTGTVPVNKEHLTITIYIFWGNEGEMLIAIS